MTQTALQAPGAGLPPAEAFISRHVIFPAMNLALSDARARALFLQEGAQIARMAGRLDHVRLERRVLIPRIRGIEDSSRNWSVAMTIEHLLITGPSMKELILTLRRGQEFHVKVDTADVKPTGKGLENIVGRFEAFQEEFDRDIKIPFEKSELIQRHVHPWFGPLNARQWNVLAALHTRIHRRQIEWIIALIGK
ncbi:hypothetical protein QQ054_32660 [Oscillatoria amoena NRMC-F 0135]|nr:hypothetical protein [Oscillatoria amoena NRMC-F 0135]